MKYTPKHKEHKHSNQLQTVPFFRSAIIQPELTINEPGDKYEQEADAMADHVMRMSENTALIPPEEEQSIQAMPISRLQRKEMLEEEEVQAMPIQRKCAACEQEESLQRQETGDEEESIQMMPMPLMRKSKGSGYSASPQLTNQLHQSKGGGSSLPKSTLTQMNQAFGTDFSHVRIHNDSQAQEMSQGIQAKAFTHGSDIYFNQGQYQPESSNGKKLLAHELTHVVQQGGQHVLRRNNDPRHARGHAGEQGVAFSHYRSQDGWIVVRGPSGSQGHGVTTSGEDGLFYNIRTKELHILDNKSLARKGNVGSATAIDPQRNLLQNLDKMIQHVENQSLKQLPYRQRILRLLRQTKATVKAAINASGPTSVKGKLPSRVKLIVSNAGGRSTGVTARLEKAGVDFLNTNQPPKSRPGTKIPALGSHVKKQQPQSRVDLSKARNSNFKTKGRVVHTDRQGNIPRRPQSTIGSSSRAPRVRYKGAGLATILPAAVNVLQDVSIRHGVAIRMKGKWTEVVRTRKNHPNHIMAFVVSLQEWETPRDGQVARAINYVLFFHGATKEEVLQNMNQALKQVPPKGWREVGPFIGWIEVTDNLDKIKDEIEKQEACFIATACYGSYLSREVMYLRSFRDKFLKRYAWGIKFINFYYETSPPIADFLIKNQLPRTVVRSIFLKPLITIIKSTQKIWNI